MRFAAVLHASLLVAVLGLVPLAGCERGGWVSEVVPTERIEVGRTRMVIRSGTVGTAPTTGPGRWQRAATYVLVPAKNPTDRDLMVTLRGDLVAGDARHELLPESLRLPAGGERVFALVAKGQDTPPGVSDAEIRVTGASTIGYPPPVQITDEALHKDAGGLTVAKAYVHNTGKGEATASIFAAFFDADRKPLQRTFGIVKLAGGGKRGFQLNGPPEAKSCQVYVGEVTY
jgi:hypothetical protein